LKNAGSFDVFSGDVTQYIIGFCVVAVVAAAAFYFYENYM